MGKGFISGMSFKCQQCVFGIWKMGARLSTCNLLNILKYRASHFKLER